MGIKDSKSILKCLEETIREQWDCDALTDYGTDETFKYRDVAVRICYLHMPDYSNEQLRMLCEHCDAKFMIASHRLANLWPEGQCPMYMIDVEDLLAMTPSVFTDDVEDKAYNLFAQRYPNGYTANDVHYEAEQPEDLMILSYTSGSTGNPKGVMLPWVSDFAYGPHVRLRLRLSVWPHMRSPSVYPEKGTCSESNVECFYYHQTSLLSLRSFGDGENHQAPCDTTNEKALRESDVEGARHKESDMPKNPQAADGSSWRQFLRGHYGWRTPEQRGGENSANGRVQIYYRLWYDRVRPHHYLL